MPDRTEKASTLVGVALTILLSATAAFAVPGDQTEPYEGSIDHPTEDCFWISVGNDRLWNYVNTDSNAV